MNKLNIKLYGYKGSIESLIYSNDEKNIIKLFENISVLCKDNIQCDSFLIEINDVEQGRFYVGQKTKSESIESWIESIKYESNLMNIF